MARIVSGDNVIAHNPYEAVEEAGERPLFILHGTSDTRISIQHSYQLRERATQVGANATFWNPDGIEYVRAASTLTAEYETQLITFFRNSLE
ncbi:MAG: hypothetical protein GY805_13280 [Chloroflexi bacterium]|nr:hypothetical protein [Chloroflexota bacterium]